MIRATKTDIAPDTQTTFVIRGIDLDGVEREEPLSLSPNALAETISEHAYSRLLLTENRTEDEQHTLLHWLEATTQTESHEVAPGTWQHTFTPHPLDELIRAKTTDAGNTLTAADLDALIERMFDHEVYEPYPMGEMTDASVFCMTRSMAHRIRVLMAKAQRSVRARKRTRRQRRAAQRRHNRGRG